MLSAYQSFELERSKSSVKKWKNVQLLGATIASWLKKQRHSEFQCHNMLQLKAQLIAFNAQFVIKVSTIVCVMFTEDNALSKFVRPLKTATSQSSNASAAVTTNYLRLHFAYQEPLNEPSHVYISQMYRNRHKTRFLVQNRRPFANVRAFSNKIIDSAQYLIVIKAI